MPCANGVLQLQLAEGHHSGLKVAEFRVKNSGAESVLTESPTAKELGVRTCSM